MSQSPYDIHEDAKLTAESPYKESLPEGAFQSSQEFKNNPYKASSAEERLYIHKRLLQQVIIIGRHPEILTKAEN